MAANESRALASVRRLADLTCDTLGDPEQLRLADLLVCGVVGADLCTNSGPVEPARVCGLGLDGMGVRRVGFDTVRPVRKTGAGRSESVSPARR